MGYLVKLMQKKWKWRYAIAAVLLLFVLWLSMLLTDGIRVFRLQKPPLFAQGSGSGIYMNFGYEILIGTVGSQYVSAELIVCSFPCHTEEFLPMQAAQY